MEGRADDEESARTDRRVRPLRPVTPLKYFQEIADAAMEVQLHHRTTRANSLLTSRADNGQTGDRVGLRTIYAVPPPAVPPPAVPPPAVPPPDVPSANDCAVLAVALMPK